MPHVTMITSPKNKTIYLRSNKKASYLDCIQKATKALYGKHAVFYPKSPRFPITGTVEGHRGDVHAFISSVDKAWLLHAHVFGPLPFLCPLSKMEEVAQIVGEEATRSPTQAQDVAQLEEMDKPFDSDLWKRLEVEWLLLK